MPSEDLDFEIPDLIGYRDRMVERCPTLQCVWIGRALIFFFSWKRGCNGAADILGFSDGTCIVHMHLHIIS